MFNKTPRSAREIGTFVAHLATTPLHSPNVQLYTLNSVQSAFSRLMAHSSTKKQKIDMKTAHRKRNTMSMLLIDVDVVVVGDGGGGGGGRNVACFIF